jgi:hypothetical protein
MSSAYATKVAEGFSQRLLKEMYDMNLADSIVNRDYEGEINGVGSKLNILNFSRISEKTYANAALSADSLYEVNSTLTIDQYKSFYWKEKTLARWLSYIKNPHATVVQQKADERSKNIDTYVLGLYGDVGAGNRVGTDYTTGTVTVDVTTGAVTGSGTTFTEAMEGRGFKAAGHTQWYRVKDYTSATAITIEDDSDDETSAYTGGAIAGGSTYTIEAATVLTITTANLLQYISKLKEKLDTAERYSNNAVPDSGRWLIVPPEFEGILVRASGVALHVPEAYQELVKKGFITELQGFKVFKSNRLTGDNTDGFRILAGHPNWCTFAEKLLEADIEEDLIGDFGSAYKDLFVYGAKVTDARRHFAAELFAKFS